MSAQPAAAASAASNTATSTTSNGNSVTINFTNSIKLPGGWVPIKEEYLIRGGIKKIAIPSAAESNNNNNGNNGGEAPVVIKTTGMNTGAERANPVAGAVASERPTFEGERNFLNHETLQKAKPFQRAKNDFISTAQSVWAAADRALREVAQQPQVLQDKQQQNADADADGGDGDQQRTAANGNDASKDAESIGTILAAGALRRGRDGDKEAQQQQQQQAAPATTNVGQDDDDEANPPVAAPAPVPVAASTASNNNGGNNKNNAVGGGGAKHDGTARSHLTNVARKRALDDEPAEAKRKRLFENKLILAPLTTVGNLPFRRVCKAFGVDVTVSEMAVSANLNSLQKSEWALLRRHECEDIFGVQLAASKGGDAAITAAMMDHLDFDYDYISLNTGCPVELFCKSGCGFGLWERRNRMREVVQSLVAFQHQPVEIKCRIGADENDPQLHKVIEQYKGWGASAVTIHGRSKKQRYSRMANYDYIESCAQLINPALPCIGNGDIFCYQDVLERKEIAPHVTSFMLGRGALIKPWVFTEIKEQRVWDISASERFDMMKKFCNYGLAHWGADEKGVATTRRFLCEWQSFLCRYVPVGLLEQQPQRINDRPPAYVGRNDLETLMASESVKDWIKLSEMLLGPAGDNFNFTPKHKSNSYAVAAPVSVEDVAAELAATGGSAAAALAGGQQKEADDLEVEG